MGLAIKAKFHLGKLVATPAVLVKVDPDYIIAALTQHVQGQWGVLDRHDWEMNEKALQYGDRLLSAYPLPNDAGNFWIITEGEGEDKVTIILLPSDY
jgi:hypothetical protein